MASRTIVSLLHHTRTSLTSTSPYLHYHYRLYTAAATSSPKAKQPSPQVPFPLQSNTTEDPPPKPESRWRRLKRERRQAPTPANRSKHSFDRKAKHSLAAAIAIMRESAWAKFDESIELTFKLGVDPRRADHNLRGGFSLPFGTGRTDRIAVLLPGGDDGGGGGGDGDKERGRILRAGAEVVGGEQFLKEIVRTKGKILKGFAVCLSTNDLLPDIAKTAGKILGPKRLLPSPAAGTVVPSGADVAAVVKDFARGRVLYRVDKVGTLQMNVGKLSFGDDMVVANVLTAVRRVWEVRPASVRRGYVRALFMGSSMGPGVSLTVEELVRRAIEEVDEEDEERFMGVTPS